ncbi:MAG: TonB family protein [Kofleriaceae bacterium]|nr:TonB family protein [Kofleriaceae bacterium]
MQPVYPDRAQEEGIAAEVLLDIDIDAAGLVENARVVRAQDHRAMALTTLLLLLQSNSSSSLLVWEAKRYPLRLAIAFASCQT